MYSRKYVRTHSDTGTHERRHTRIHGYDYVHGDMVPFWKHLMYG